MSHKDGTELSAGQSGPTTPFPDRNDTDLLTMY